MSKSKNILFYSYSLPPKNDGVTQRIMMWLHEFKSNYPDDNIVLVTTRIDTEDKICGYPVFKLISDLIPTYLSNGLQNNIYIQKKRNWKDNFDILKTIVQEHDIQYIYITGPCFLYPFKLIKAEFTYIKMIYGYHTHALKYIQDYFEDYLGENITKLYSKFSEYIHNIAGISSIDTITTMSDELAIYVKEKLVDSHQSFYVIPPIIDKNKFPYKPRSYKVLKKEIKILYVGRISKEKSVHVLIETLIKYWKYHYPKLILTLVGGGPLLDEFINKYEFQKRKNLHFMFKGLVEHKLLKTYYYQNDIFIFPSLTETLGFVTIEAMSCGIPIIAANSGGTKSLLIHNESGILLNKEVWEQHYLCSNILNLAQDPKKRKELVIRAEQKTKDWSISNNVIFLRETLFSD